MGLGDLLNFDYGFDAYGAPMYDVDSSLFNDLMGSYTGGMPDLGVDFYDGGVPTFEIDQLALAASPETADAIARAQEAVAGGGAPGADNLSTIYTNFGLPYSGADLGLSGGRSGVGDVLKNLARSGGGGSGGGGNTIGISAPSISSPVADSIPAVPTRPAQTGALPAPPPIDTTFRPTPFDTSPPRQMPEGLQRLFERLGAR